MADTDGILLRVRQCLRHALKLSDEATAAIGLDATPATLPGWTSMAHLELMLAIERDFAVTFDADEIANLASTAAIVATLQRARA